MKYKIVYKDNSTKHIEIGNDIKPLYCPSFNKDGRVYRIDDDDVKILNGTIINMSQVKASFLMDNDNVKRFIPVNGIVLSADADKYSGYTAAFINPTISLSNSSIRNFSFGDFVRGFFEVREDTTYYSNKGVLFNDIGLHNIILTDHNFHLHDLDEFICQADGIQTRLAARNVIRINNLISEVISIMIIEASSTKSFELYKGTINSINAKMKNNASYSPEMFEKEFGAYPSIDEYLQDRKILLKPLIK